MATASTLALTSLIATWGDYPRRGTGNTTPVFTLGMIQTMAPVLDAFGAPDAQGQQFAIAAHTGLFSVVGPAFGGDGQQHFDLPNLTNRSVVGGTNLGATTADTLEMTWLIAADNLVGAPPVGALVPFVGNFAPDGWMVADGRTLSIGAHVDLFMTIGTLFGGDGQADFMLPDMNGMAAYGAGQAGGVTVDVGAKVAGAVPGIALNYLIATAALYPMSGGDGGFPDNEPVLGQIIAYGGLQAPKGWSFCDGSLLPIEDNRGLFTLIGTSFGGDGKTDFALPDLRGKRVVGR
ncbi:tail fiber protein [Sphingomonas sp. SUN039]|uniref:tail fiber protein n=1 Tax=Sphingomonas sp. SUN039 TaxID=2937787 RepID=UPI0021645560|nr:tail fiber protein [Sphingomonas sp. SUN039]UVO54028.1 tail fiber protein [Sphingomonas sp. SUN039]